MSEPKSKPFEISKHVVFEAYGRVKANKGAAGVDEESIAAFEVDLRGNLYKLWNRMSSGSYFPPSVKMVEIPKPGGNGATRVLGVPTVADRVAQTVAAMCLEPKVEPIFHPDSYGYRPRRSALGAVAACRQRCWRTDWVIDLDIKGFFDNLDHAHDRIRHDKIDKSGTVTLRVAGRLRHIGVGRTHARTHVILLVQDLHVRIINATTGELLRDLTIDPNRDYQPTGKPPGPAPK